MRLSIISLLFFTLLSSGTEDLKNKLDQKLELLMPKVIEWRHDIHKYPELANREFRTSKKVADHLESLGLEVETGIAYTGVVALIEGGKPGPTVALRADMDALPVEEKTGLPFASKVRTQYLGNDVGVMHACGHDAHVSILMGVAEFLAENKSELAGNVLLIFQPAEEGPPEGEGGGAKMMLEEGLFEKFKPEVIFGLHVTNIPNGYIAIKPGPALAAASAYRITIKGVQTHGSTPWAGIDPIMATAQLIQSLNTVVSRRINIINNPAVVSVGMVEAGTRNNIIPEESMLMGTIRTFDPELRKEIYNEIRQIAEGVAQGTGTEITVEFDVGGFYPVTVNDKPLLSKLKNSLVEASEGKFLELEAPATGAEDFSYFSQEIPGVYFWLGVNKPGVGLDSTNFGDRSGAAGNHSPYFYVDDGALDEGVKGLTYLVLDYLGS
ncbi:MAG: amidohydrolase [Proteobacteria bacterium]|nr:amidohydrolase [Pseudomonadota bacterium]MDA0899510.1 amidohydrolase [Pseudomonadota bacterium]MDA1056282.1 amidohydrolase [Pseudomonadota bacterium]